MTPAKPRKRLRTALRASPGHPEPDGALPLALATLQDAVHALTHPRPHQHSRYQDLRDALTETRNGHSHTAPGSSLPFWIDSMKLKMTVDLRTHTITRLPHRIPTPIQLKDLTERRYRPQDCERINQVATEIASWSQAVDDLFAIKPIYLPDACPQCAQRQTQRLADDGERVRTPALAVTAVKGAWCQACHASWQPDQLVFLGRLLGYHTEGITA